jgi:hypothetical protein
MLDCLILEAGTPNVAGGIVLELPSIMNEVGFENIQNKTELLDYGTNLVRD